MKKKFKYISFFIISIISIAVITLAFMQTRLFKNWLRDYIVTEVNENISSQLRIGRINGNFFSYLEIENILLENINDTLACMQKLSLHYDLKQLMSNELNVQSAIIDSLKLNIRQLNDSTWNFSDVFEPETEIEPGNNSSNGIGLRISLNSLKIVNGSIRISTQENSKIIPCKIDSFNLITSAFYSDDEQIVNIKRLSFDTHNPDFSLNQIKFNAQKINDVVRLNDLKISTSRNEIISEGEMIVFPLENIKVKLSTSPFDFSEFGNLFDADIISLKPILKLTAAQKENDLEIRISAENRNQKVDLKGNANLQGAIPSYNFKLDVRKINIADWLGENFPETKLNGSINIDGKGFNLDRSEVNLELNFSQSQFLKWSFNQLASELHLKKGMITISGSLFSDSGNIQIAANIKDFADIPKYNFEMSLNRFNLASIILNDDLYSDINIVMNAWGQGIDFKDIEANAVFNSVNSQVNNYKIDSLAGKVELQQGSIIIHDLLFENEIAKINSKGKISIDSISSVNFNAKLKNISLLNKSFELDNFSTGGSINGNVTGTPDSLSSNLSYQLSDLSYSNITADTLSGNLLLNLNRNQINSKLTADINRINIGKTLINYAKVKAEMLDNKFNTEINIEMHDSVNSFLKSSVLLDTTTIINISKLALNVEKSHWINSEPIRLEITKDNYNLTSFYVSSDSQRIIADGKISSNGGGNINLAVHQLQLNDFNPLFNEPNKLGGKLDFDVQFKGTFQSPEIKSNLSIEDAEIKKFVLGNVDADINLANSNLSWNLSLITPAANKIFSSGYLPINMYADSTGYTINREKPLEAEIKFDKFDISALSSINSAVDEANGKINCDLKFKSNLDKLSLNGFLKLYDSNFKSDLYGINYNKIEFEISSDDNKINLNNFLIHSTEGSLSASGFINYNKGLLGSDFNPIQIKLKAYNFLAADSRNYDLKIDGDINFIDKNELAEFFGDMEILRSRFWMPYFIEEFKQNSVDESVPLLVKAIQEKDTTTNIINTEVDSTVSSPAFVKQLNGIIKIKIPRNTWLQSPDLNMEIKGDLKIIFREDLPEIFGYLEIVRGTYTILGKKFVVDKGRIDFEGGKEYNPSLLIEVSYSFRDINKDLRYLQLNIGGKIKSPELHFFLEAAPIEEKDAISYLLFGRSVEELSQNQKSSVSSSTNQIAQGLASNFMASQLSNTVGNALGLDVVEVSLENNWKRANFSAGKYVTDRLYISYTKGVGEGESNETNSDEFAFRYEVTPWLFLQLIQGTSKSNGYDVLFKFEF